MANDEHGMPLPSDESPLPWKWNDFPIEVGRTEGGWGSEILAMGDDGMALVGEIYVNDDDDRFVRHAANNIIECREIVRRLAEYAGPGFINEANINDLIRDAARLWAKMQREVGDGA